VSYIGLLPIPGASLHIEKAFDLALLKAELTASIDDFNLSIVDPPAQGALTGFESHLQLSEDTGK
jgi:hypothetical protein